MPTTEQLNRSLAGRYDIERLIGEGGMATVYLARDVRHNRKVALKVLKPDLGAVVGVERFLSEIQVTANLQHPNLLPLFDSGAADSLLFYVMPYIEGESLRVRLNREKQLPIDEVVRIATSVASALDYAHRHGVIHRDLKPENILLHEGQPMVADFGIALAVSNAGGNRITQTGVSLGTPQYMSPEQATGDRTIDGRTDVYSLGAVTYEMLTAEPPHTGNTSQAVIARVLTERPRSIRASRPSVPEHIEAAVERALEKLPADRWASAREFSEALTGARVVTRSTHATSAEARADSAAGGRHGRVRKREIVAWTVALLALGSSAATTVVTRQPPPAGLVQFEVQQPENVIATATGSAASVALSKDGSTLVFQASRSGGAQMLYVRRLSDRYVQEIRGTEAARGPTLSPDGSEVAFATSIGIGAIKRVSIQGGTPRTLIDSAATNSQVSWDAEVIVAGGADNLWTVAPDGGPRTLLAKPDTTRGHMRLGFPDVLPGGKAAVITIWKGNTDLESIVLGVVEIPSGKVTELGVRGTNPHYTPAGGGYIVYATADGWIYAVPFSARSGKLTAKPFAVVEGVRVGNGGAAAIAVADNGMLAYLTGGAIRAERLALVVDRKGNAQPLGAKAGIHNVPRVSPDGRQVAMATATQAFGFRGPDIWRYDIASKVLSRVTTDSNSVFPSWTPDGEQIAFAKFSSDTVGMARPLYATATAVMLVRLKKRIVDVSLGRSRSYMAIRTRTSSNDDIWVAHLDSLASPRPFLTEAYNEQAAAVSPNGKLLAYTTNRTGRGEVYVRPIVGAGPELQVSTDGGTEPRWGADSRELIYRTPTDFVAARLSTDARIALLGTTPLFRDEYQRVIGAANYDVFPDGQRFVVMRDEARATSATGSPLVVMLNWYSPMRKP